MYMYIFLVMFIKHLNIYKKIIKVYFLFNFYGTLGNVSRETLCITLFLRPFRLN